MLTIDGSEGEGGGQMLRTSLSLSLLSGEPFRMHRIRAGRGKPGLMRQHLTALQAAAALSKANVEGAAVGSTEICFRPGKIQAGDYEFSIGTAGSTTLVLQTLLPALMLADGPSTLVLEGGTHNPSSPPFDFLARSFLPLIRRMGPHITVRLERAGFYPAGGGRIRVHIEPVRKLAPLSLPARGKLLARRGRALLSSVPRSVAERELAVLAERLDLTAEQLSIETISPTHGPGNAVIVEVESEHLTEVFVAFGERGTAAERVAHQAANEAQEYLRSEAAVGVYLADQLLLPLALAQSGSFRTLAPSLHARTQMQVVERFLGGVFRIEHHAENDCSIHL